MIDLNECLRKGLIRKIAKSERLAEASIRKARILLAEGKADLKEEHFNSAMIMAYTALLNSSRAIMFKDGYRERSHACVARYLEAKYKDKIPVGDIELLDYFRETRHDIQYDVDYLAEKETVERIMEFAGRFLDLAEELIKE